MVSIQRGQHVAVLGINGSGKSYGVRNWYLRPFEQIVVADTEDADFADFPTVSVGTAVRLANSRYSFVVKVHFEGDLTEKDLVNLDALCRGILKRPRDVVTPKDRWLPALAVYFDEVTDFSDPSSIPKPLKDLIRKGRKRGVTVITGTQRPQGLNKWFLSQSQHRVYYYISDYDARLVKEYAPGVEQLLPRIPYGSYRSIYTMTGAKPIVLEPVPAYDWRPRLAAR